MLPRDRVEASFRRSLRQLAADAGIGFATYIDLDALYESRYAPMEDDGKLIEIVPQEQLASSQAGSEAEAVLLFPIRGRRCTSMRIRGARVCCYMDGNLGKIETGADFDRVWNDAPINEVRAAISKGEVHPSLPVLCGTRPVSAQPCRVGGNPPAVGRGGLAFQVAKGFFDFLFRSVVERAEGEARRTSVIAVEIHGVLESSGGVDFGNQNSGGAAMRPLLQSTPKLPLRGSGRPPRWRWWHRARRWRTARAAPLAPARSDSHTCPSVPARMAKSLPASSRISCTRCTGRRTCFERRPRCSGCAASFAMVEAGRSTPVMTGALWMMTGMGDWSASARK